MMENQRRFGWKWIGRLLLTFVVFLTLALVLVARSEGIKLVHPERTYPAVTPADFPELAGWADVQLVSADGLKLQAWYVPPDERGAVLVLVHGLGGNRDTMLPEAAFLARQGYGSLSLDLRNHGDSEGDLTTLGYAEVEDIREAVEFLAVRPEVDRDRIGLMGESMGAVTVLRSAARIAEVDLVIAISGYATLEDNVAQGVRILTGLPPFPFAPLVVYFGEQEAGVKLADVRPVDDIDDISPRPVMFIHGDQDNLVTVENSRRMFDLAAEPKALYIIEGAGHGSMYETDPVEFERQVLTFLAQHIGAGGR